MSGLWVLVALVACWLGTNCRAQPQDCFQATDLIVGHTTIDLPQAVFKEYKKGSYYMQQTSYLYIERGFQGVTLEVEGAENTTTMFFSAGQQCFDSSTAWWGVVVGCWHYRSETTIWCSMSAGNCKWQCIKKHTSPQYRLRYRVLANGPSRWRDCPPPRNCEHRPWTDSPPHEDRTCGDPPLTSTSPPHTSSTSPPANTTTISSIPWIVVIVAIVLLVLVLMVVVVVGVLLKRCHTRATASLAVPDTQAQSHNTPAASLTPRHHNLPAPRHDGMKMMPRLPGAPAPTPPGFRPPGTYNAHADARAAADTDEDNIYDVILWPPRTASRSTATDDVIEETDDVIDDVIGEGNTYLQPLPSPRPGRSAGCRPPVPLPDDVIY